MTENKTTQTAGREALECERNKNDPAAGFRTTQPQSKGDFGENQYEVTLKTNQNNPEL